MSFPDRKYLQKFDPKVCARNKSKLKKQKLIDSKKKNSRDAGVDEVMNERKQQLKDLMNQIAEEEKGNDGSQPREDIKKLSFPSAQIFVE